LEAARPAYRPLDAGWWQWLAENRLRDCTPASMLQTMTQAGLNPAESSEALAALERNPIYVAARRHQQLLRKRDSVLAHLQHLWASDPGASPTPRSIGTFG
jgi:hypothetical protein